MAHRFSGWCLLCVIQVPTTTTTTVHLLVLLIRILSVFMTVKITFIWRKNRECEWAGKHFAKGATRGSEYQSVFTNALYHFNAKLKRGNEVMVVVVAIVWVVWTARIIMWCMARRSVWRFVCALANNPASVTSYSQTSLTLFIFIPNITRSTMMQMQGSCASA